MNEKTELSPESFWEPGTQILQQDLWGSRLVTSRPVTVVKDVSEYLALYTHPNAPYRSGVIKDRYSMPVSQRIDVYMEMLDPGTSHLEESVSGDYHVLTLTPPNSWHSVWLFWTSDWRLETYYVNFQAPIRRTSCCILVRDYALDIAVEPNMAWSWKDADEFEELIGRGFFTESQISSIRTEADRTVRAIENRESPFSGAWKDWRPDTEWPVPEVPDDWHIMDS
ncbi:MAG: DUF402 domain-containing protein [Dehalococcoidia bacterium]|nr:DUF402 domain-containing protein [Dehalococcoidia bacterium]